MFDDSDHHLFHGKAYLRAARLMLFEIINDRYLWSEENAQAAGFQIPYTSDILIPPALFSIQHGIEVCLKATLLDAGVPFKVGHDTQKLYALLKQHVLQNEWKQITINKWQVVISFEYIDRVKTDVLIRIDPLIDYFYQNLILTEKLGRPPKPDPKNEIFRYPKCMSGDDYDIMELAKKVTEADVKELIKKLDDVYSCLMDLGYLVGETKAQSNNPEAIIESKT